MIDKVNKEEFRDFALDYIKHFDAIPLKFEDSSGIVIKASVCWQLAKELKLINKLLNKEISWTLPEMVEFSIWYLRCTVDMLGQILYDETIDVGKQVVVLENIII